MLPFLPPVKYLIHTPHSSHILLLHAIQPLTAYSLTVLNCRPLVHSAHSSERLALLGKEDWLTPNSSLLKITISESIHSTDLLEEGLISIHYWIAPLVVPCIVIFPCWDSRATMDRSIYTPCVPGGSPQKAAARLCHGPKRDDLLSLGGSLGDSTTSTFHFNSWLLIATQSSGLAGT